MNNAQSPEILEEILAQLDRVSEIVKKLKTVDLETTQISDKAGIAKIITMLARGCEVSKLGIEAYRGEDNANPEYLALFRHDMISPVANIKSASRILSELNWNVSEISQDVKDLVRHSESLWATIDNLV